MAVGLLHDQLQLLLLCSAVKLIKVHANLNYLTPFAATFSAIDISRQTKNYLRHYLGRFIKKTAENASCTDTQRD